MMSCGLRILLSACPKCSTYHCRKVLAGVFSFLQKVQLAPKFNHVVVFMKEIHTKNLVKLGSKIEKFCALKLLARVYWQFSKNENSSLLGRNFICISKSVIFSALSSEKNAPNVLLDPSFQIYTIKMAFFTELHAENIIYFDIHMKFLSKSELFLFLENCR